MATSWLAETITSAPLPVLGKTFPSSNSTGSCMGGRHPGI